MADDIKHPEAWGRRSQIRLEDLPKADPIAYLGTERHPVSVPPTTRDVETTSTISVPPKPHHTGRRMVVTAIGVAVLIPMAVTLTSSGDTDRGQTKVSGTPLPGDQAPPAANPTPGTHPAAGTTAESIAADLPPGGLADNKVAEQEINQSRSVADWTDSNKPEDGVGALAEPAPPAKHVVSAHPVTITPSSTAERRSTAHGAHRTASNGVSTPFDFSAAMNAVAVTNLGPAQCGPAAVGTAPVAVTFSPSGRATRAVIENGPLRGTETGSCVAMHLRDVRIAPFEGDTATIQTAVLLR